ncbi:MAG: hypothetical protein V3S11_04600 [Elusimicrobiota bacterium]
MNCPKCERKVDDDLETCPGCGIIFIKWLIRQHRLRQEPGRGVRVFGLKALSFRLPRQFSRRALAVTALVGLAAGLSLSFLLPRRAGLGPRVPARISSRVVEKRTAAILEEAREQARPYGVTVSAADFSDYFGQGFRSLNSKNLMAAAAESGWELATRLGNL